MAYFNFQEGAGGGSGVDYPLRTMVHDEQERLRAELERQGLTGRDEELLTRGEAGSVITLRPIRPRACPRRTRLRPPTC